MENGQYHIRARMDALSAEIASKIMFLPTEENPISGALTAVGYRALASKEFSDDFASAINISRYREEKSLFAFLVSALSSLECFCFGIYFVGAHLNAKDFQLSTRWHLIKIGNTVDAFKKAFAQQRLTQALEQLKTAAEYRRLSDFRNVLAHRCVPQRWYVLPLPGSGESPRRVSDMYANGSQAGIYAETPDVNADLTRKLLIWTEQTLTQLADEASLFVRVHL